MKIWKGPMKIWNWLMMPKAVKEQVRNLSSTDPSERSNAAGALGHLGDKTAVGPLLEHLDDVDHYTKWRVVGALGRIADKRSIAPLVQLLDDPSLGIRLEVAKSLLGLGYEPATLFEQIRRWCSVHGWCDDQRMAIGTNKELLQLLQQTGGEHSNPALIRVVQHPNTSNADINQGVRQVAVEILSDLADPTLQGFFVELLADNYRWVAREAAKAIARFSRGLGILLLRDALRNKGVTHPSCVTEVLMELKWEPDTEHDRIRYASAIVEVMRLSPGETGDHFLVTKAIRAIVPILVAGADDDTQESADVFATAIDQLITCFSCGDAAEAVKEAEAAISQLLTIVLRKVRSDQQNVILALNERKFYHRDRDDDNTIITVIVAPPRVRQAMALGHPTPAATTSSLSPPTSLTGQWSVVSGYNACRDAVARNIIPDYERFDAAVLTWHGVSIPKTVSVVGTVQCHVCSTMNGFEKVVHCASGGSITPITCSGCDCKIDLMISPRSDLKVVFVIASRGTQLAQTPAGDVRLHVEKVT